MCNPFPYEIFIDVLNLETEGVEVIKYPTSSRLEPSGKSELLLLQIKPVQVGKLSIKGLQVRIFNTVYTHAVNELGLSKEYFEVDGQK